MLETANQLAFFTLKPTILAWDATLPAPLATAKKMKNALNAIQALFR